MFGRVAGLHQIAAQKVIDREKTAGFRVPQRIALNRREPLRRELQRQLIHQKPWVDEDMRGVREDFIAPAFERHSAVHKSRAEFRRDLGFLVSLSTQVVAEYLETIAVQLAHPTFDWNFPVRVRVEMAAHEAHSDRLGGFWGRRRRALTKLCSDGLAGQCSV